jgi:hypothetical protein
MLKAVSLGTFLVDAKAIAIAEVVSTRTIAGQTKQVPLATHVKLLLKQSLLGEWDKQVTATVAGGSFKGRTFQVADQPVPKKGATVLVLRTGEDLRKIGSVFLLVDGDIKGISDANLAEATRELSEIEPERAKGHKISEFRSDLLKRPLHDFFLPMTPGDPKWAGTYPTATLLEVWDNTADIGAEDAFYAVQCAIDTWNCGGAMFSLRNVARRGGFELSNPATRNLFRWVPGNGWSPNVLASTSTLSYTNGLLIDAEIVFWDAHNWSTNPRPGDFDVESVALHELGHLIGIGSHTAGSSDVMQSGIGAGVTRRSLSQNDIAALQGLYGVHPVDRFLVYRWQKGRDHFYTCHVYGELAPDIGYNYEGAPFQLFAPGTPNTTRFFRWYHPAGVHLYTTDPNGELAPQYGYDYEGDMGGNIATVQLANTVPLFRWRSQRGRGYLYTTDPTGELAPTSGYVLEGSVGFVIPR